MFKGSPEVKIANLCFSCLHSRKPGTMIITRKAERKVNSLTPKHTFDASTRFFQSSISNQRAIMAQLCYYKLPANLSIKSFPVWLSDNGSQDLAKAFCHWESSSAVLRMDARQHLGGMLPLPIGYTPSAHPDGNLTVHGNWDVSAQPQTTTLRHNIQNIKITTSRTPIPALQNICNLSKAATVIPSLRLQAYRKKLRERLGQVIYI